MPIWLQVLYAVIAPVLLSIASWVLVQIWKMRIRMAELETEIAAMQPKCIKHDAQLEGLTNAISRIDRNLVRVGKAAGAEDLEYFNG